MSREIPSTNTLYYLIIIKLIILALFCNVTRIINIIYKGHIGSLRTDQMADHSKEIEHKALLIKDGNGDIVFELSEIGILSVENSEGSLTVEIELNDDLRYGRSVFKTE